MTGAAGKLAAWDRTIEDVCQSVAANLEASPATCECFWGAQYLEYEGAPGNRVVFVPEISPGDLSVRTMGRGGVMGNGNAAKYTFTVRAHIWGASSDDREGAPEYGEPGKGWGQNRGADRILADLLAAWHKETRGRANSGAMEAQQDTQVVKYGEVYIVPLTYEAVLIFTDTGEYKTGTYTATTSTEIRES